jgi:drug/metabolite transporter (DMT)-like permease
VTGVLFGWLVFKERIGSTTWVGLAIVLAGSLIIQFGSKTQALGKNGELETASSETERP